MFKKVAVNLIKFGLVLGLLWWLHHSGKLDMAMLAELRKYPHRVLLATLFCFINILLVSWRWRYLLQARLAHAPALSELYFINWIGLFFSTVLPGSVTGDVIKIFYVKKNGREVSNAFLLFSCFLDRLMGVTGLVLLMGFFSLINYPDLLALSPRLKPLLHFNFLILAITVTGLLIFFFTPRLIDKLLEYFSKIKFLQKIQPRLSDLWRDLTVARPKMFWAITISFVVQFIGVVIFHLLVSPQYITDLSLMMVLSFIPLGFVAVAIPIAPGGLGVGHAAFATLFSFAGESNGANFFNMYFILMIVVNIMGAIPWLVMRKKASN
jgi:uncharacterized membrane protein YbhN (UPF0104 family)